MDSLRFTLDELPPPTPAFPKEIRRAPKRALNLSTSEVTLALKNALRYIPPKHHEIIAPEFLNELKTRGRIYGYRYRPEGPLTGKPVDSYSGNCLEGKAFQVMIDNNLDFKVALYPYELVTYGETGQVCQNWMQYRLIKKYLEALSDRTTLVLASGHPVGLFRSNPQAPRVMLTNGLMVGMYDNTEQWNRAAALGVANYGQMTAGGWMYIGPQGIVHGTYNTLTIAGRIKLGIPRDQNLKGHLFVSSGLGGMSGAQGKAAVIAGGVAIIAEVDSSRIQTRFDQGWVTDMVASPGEAFHLANKYRSEKVARAIAFQGNVIDLLEYANDKKERIDLLSDQTSCHAVYEGGYCPQGLTFKERTELLAKDPETFRKQVDQSLRRHFEVIQKLTERGTYFFDYGNSFMKAVLDAGVPEICRNGKDEREGFIWPSYVEDILGPELFDYGYGPFRWVCLSGEAKDLEKTDGAAAELIAGLRAPLRYQDKDNLDWVRGANANRLVVGTQSRILYQDAQGRMALALKFNQMVRDKVVGPIMLGRDHHDTGGTDSPFRETSNIKDGSNVMADMATLCFAGNAARGMSLVALHNGGGVGIGKAINGGFGLVLDGSPEKDAIIKSAMNWDVMGGVARRAWAQNPHSVETCEAYNAKSPQDDHITLPFAAQESLLRQVLSRYESKS